MLNLRALVFFAAVFIFTFSIGSAADSPLMGVLSGQVLNQTVSAKGIAGLEIILHQSINNKKTIVGRTQADETGSFSFQGLKAEKSIVYAVSTNYRGVKYFSNPIHLKGNNVSPTKLMIYEITDQAPDLYVKMHHIIFEKVEGALQVKEIMIVENPGRRTVIGSGELKPDKKETLRISLPAQATNIQYMPSLDPVLAESGTSFSTAAPLLPGINQFIFGYTIPSPGAKYIFAKSFYLKTGTVSVVFSDKDLRIKSDQLVSRMAAFNSDQPFYQLFGEDFARGSQITMRLSFSEGPDYFKWIVIALVAFVMGVGIAIPFLKRRPNADTENRDYPDKERGPGSLAKQRLSVVRSLAELDDLFESGRLVPQAYHKKRELLLEEAKVLSKKMQLSSQPLETEQP